MKDQPWEDLNQICPVGRKWCRFKNAPQKFREPSPKILGCKKHQIFDQFSRDNVSAKSWPTFHDLWPRNGWDPFAHCDPPFGGHYVATIVVATCLVHLISRSDNCQNVNCM